MTHQLPQPGGLTSGMDSSTANTITTLPSLSIGAVQIGFPVVQAALSGYSDGPMRIVARRLGAPYTLAEVKIGGGHTGDDKADPNGPSIDKPNG